ncbi:MAG: hypothetical protein ACQEQU_04975 [Spirochaetota bacterium]
MRRKLVVMLVLITLISGIAFAGEFPAVTTETMGGESFSFPGEALQGDPVVFALAMSTSRDNGQWQLEQLLAWHKELIQPGVLPSLIDIFHFSVIESPPRFVRGFIRRGTAKELKGNVAENRAAVLFVEDAAGFSRQSGIPIDDRPTIVLLRPNGTIAGYVKGTVSPEAIELLQQLIRTTTNLNW